MTLSDLQTYLQLGTLSVSEEAYYTALLSSAKSQVSAYLGQDVDATTFTKYYDGMSTQAIPLGVRLITSITTVHVDPLRDFGPDTLLASTEYYLRDGILYRYSEQWPGRTIYFITDLYPSYRPGQANIKVVGANTALSSNTSIQLALSLIVRQAVALTQFGRALTSESHDSYSYKLSDGSNTIGSSGFTQEVDRLLSPFRSLGVV